MTGFVEIRELILSILAYGGGAAVIAYLIFQYLAKEWLRNLFEKNLEALKHQQQFELQKLRVQVEALLSGTIKLQERDFEVLPQAWAKLNNAHRALSSTIAAYKTYPDLSRTTELGVNEILENSGLSRAAIERIKTSPDKTSKYMDEITWKRINDVKKSVAELKTFIDELGIFLPKSLKEKFDLVVQKLWSAIVDKEIGHEEKDLKMQRGAMDTLRNEITPKIEEIEADIHTQLRSHSNWKV